MTGFALAVGTLVLAWWLVTAAVGGTAFDAASAVIGSWLGIILLIGWTFALCYHLCNGIRHLFWDAGSLLELKGAYASGWLVLLASVVLTLVAWAWGYAAMGGGV